MRIFNIIFIVLFLIFAALQFNDPDPVIWIFIYGAMAIICWMAVLKKFNRYAYIVLSLIYLTYAIILIPGLREWLTSEDKSLLFDDLAKMQFLYIEETREFLGLIICLIVLLINYLYSRIYFKTR